MSGRAQQAFDGDDQHPSASGAGDPDMSAAADGPELSAAKRLLDCAKRDGFTFQRITPGPDGPLRGVRETPEFLDEIYVTGLWEPDSCTAIRWRRSSLVVPGGLPVTERVTGDALTVLHTVVADWPT